MENKAPFLSLCIPTYNRAEKLNICLQAILGAIDDQIEDKVEIVVSDNNSEDNTSQIIEMFIERGLKIKYFKNDRNLGATKNIMLLLTEYSHGEYIWIIGDDDFIDKNSLRYIINLFTYKKDIDLIVLKYRLFENINYYKSFIEEVFYEPYEYSALSSNYVVANLSQALDFVCDGGNILGTFMSSMIYRKQRINQKYLVHITDEVDYWDKRIQHQFPNAYFVLSSFIHEKEVLYVKEPLLSIVIFEKDWDDKLPFLYYKILPDMYTYLINLGLEEKFLKKTRRNLFFVNFKVLISGKKVPRLLIFRNMIRYFSLTYVFNFIFRCF
jgi:glycosyltransferase involved in cell wall biosynthesis